MSEALKVLIYKAYYASNKVLTLASGSYFIASSTATAVATVAPTIGLLPSKEKLIFESFLGSKNPQALILRALRQKFRFADIFRYEKICAKSAVLLRIMRTNEDRTTFCKSSFHSTVFVTC